MVVTESYTVAWSAVDQLMFLRNILSSSSGSMNALSWIFIISTRLATCIHADFLPGLFFDSLKKVAICSSEISVGFQRTTGPFTPEDNTLRYNNCVYVA